MPNVRRVTADLPVALINDALRVSGKSLTATLAEGLRLVKRWAAYDRAMQLKGRVDLDIDIGSSRERRRR